MCKEVFMGAELRGGQLSREEVLSPATWIDLRASCCFYQQRSSSFSAPANMTPRLQRNCALNLQDHRPAFFCHDIP